MQRPIKGDDGGGGLVVTPGPAHRARPKGATASRGSPAERRQSGAPAGLPAAGPALAGPGARRFVEPYRFDDGARRALDAALAAAGLDDATGRAVFIGAIAYDLAVLQATLAETPDAPPDAPAPHQPIPPTIPLADQVGVTAGPREPAAEAAPRPVGAGGNSEAAPASDTPPAGPGALLGLVAAAETLAGRLGALVTPARAQLLSALSARDPFAREHGPAYLTALTLEVERLAAAGRACATAAAEGEEVSPAPAAAPMSDPASAPACAPAPAETAKPPRPRKPAVTRAVMRFITDAGRVYRECFDRTPGTGADDPFPRALAAIAAATGTALPEDPRILQRALAGSGNSASRRGKR